MRVRTVFTCLMHVLVVAGVMVAVGGAPAIAGTYDVVSCSQSPASTPPRAPSGSDDAWVFETDDSEHYESIRDCPPSDDAGIVGLVVQDKRNTAGADLSRFAQW